MPDVHKSARVGFARDVGAYADGRPSYPGEVSTWLRDDLGLGVGKLAVDLGAGTGKFIPVILGSGARAVAVEPSNAMLRFMSRLFKDVDLIAGSAFRIPLPDCYADAVVCAQSFHWFGVDQASGEVQRVLKLGGGLGLVWNVRDESVKWVREISDVIDPYVGETPRFRRFRWSQMLARHGFSPITRRTFKYLHVGSPDDVILKRVLSISFIASLEADKKAEVVEKLMRIIRNTPALNGGRSIGFPYITRAYSCRRLW